MTAELTDERLAERPSPAVLGSEEIAKGLRECGLCLGTGIDLSGPNDAKTNPCRRCNGVFSLEWMAAERIEYLEGLCKSFASELQAYRAKRETHVLVPREPTVAIRDALYSWDVDSNPTAYERWAELLRLALLAASDGNPP